MKKNIEALQIHSDTSDKYKNFEKVERLLEDNKDKILSSDILVLPEVWSHSWYPDKFIERAEDNNGETVSFLCKIAKKYSVNIIGGSFIRKTNEGCRNSCPVIDRSGNLITFYDKIHLFPHDKEADILDEGKNPVIVDIEGLKIGLTICYDIRFPELFRYMAQTRPELYVNLSAWPQVRQAEYEILASSRALENQAYVLGLSLCGNLINDFNFSGNSFLYGADGRKIKQIGNKEEILSFEIDTDEVYSIRSKMNHLDKAKPKIFDKIDLVKIG